MAPASQSDLARPEIRRLARRHRAASRKARPTARSRISATVRRFGRKPSPSSGARAPKSPQRSRRNFIWPCHRFPGTPIATGSPKSPQRSASIVGTAGKIARDIALLSQTEVAEAFEPSAQGRGGSSTMPQKRNPVGSAVILSAATRVPPLVSTMIAAMVQEHERGLGGWQAEWETLPEIFLRRSRRAVSFGRDPRRSHRRQSANGREPLLPHRSRPHRSFRRSPSQSMKVGTCAQNCRSIRPRRRGNAPAFARCRVERPANAEVFFCRGCGPHFQPEEFQWLRRNDRRERPCFSPVHQVR